ncbi:MAG TPA: TAXI family TRAP transporter solute-binding subunit [Woeseiaceae bacterium]|nr:TAXI family TRAP transporter solute-binding subunit [Woeseiaceae bacterium]
MAEPHAAAFRLRAIRAAGPLAFLFAMAVLAACTQGPVELRLVAPSLPVDRLIADELLRAFDGNEHIRLTLVPHTDQNATSSELLERGDGELALVSNNESYRKGVETVIPLYQTVLHIAYRSNFQPVDATDLLIGTTVFAGGEDSASRRMLMEAAGRLGIRADSIRFVDSETLHPDVIVLFAPVLPELMREFHDYKLFSMGTPDQLGHGSQVESVNLLRPQFRPIILPANLYPGINSEPIVTIAVDKLLVVRSDVPKAVVYHLVSEILRLKPALSAEQPGLFHKLSGDFDASGSTFVVHPGAQAYIERNAPSAYERYSGVAEVAITVLVGLVSGIFAIVRIYRIKRKNRIDTFYQRAIAIRRSVADTKDPAARSRALTEIRQLQDSAFDQLVDERLAADESFRIFITLSNDIIADLR